MDLLQRHVGALRGAAGLNLQEGDGALDVHARVLILVSNNNNNEFNNHKNTSNHNNHYKNNNNNNDAHVLAAGAGAGLLARLDGRGEELAGRVRGQDLDGLDAREIYGIYIYIYMCSILAFISLSIYRQREMCDHMYQMWPR